MFDGFQDQKDAAAKKRWFASAGASAVVYVAIGGIVVALAGKTVHKSMSEAQIDVTFHAVAKAEPDLPRKDEPPPPPPPKKTASGGRRPGKRVALTEPTKISDVKLDEMEPTGAAPVVDEELFGDEEEETVPSPPPPPPPPPSEPEPARLPDPVEEADEVTPAVALEGNAAPRYPEDMRRKGVEATVILEVRISETGDVVSVELLRGEEPFATAALAAVRSWRYRPAQQDGRAVAFTRIVKIPFRLRS